MKRLFSCLMIVNVIFYSSYGMQGLQALAAVDSFAEFESNLQCESSARALSLKGYKGSPSAKDARKQMHNFISQRQNYLEEFLKNSNDISVVNKVYLALYAFMERQGSSYQKSKQYETDKQTLEKLKQKSTALAVSALPKPCPYNDLTQSTIYSFNAIQSANASLPNLLKQKQQLDEQQRSLEEQIKKAQIQKQNAQDHLQQKRVQQKKSATQAKTKAEELRNQAAQLEQQAEVFDKQTSELEQMMDDFVLTGDENKK